jgi:hypothetical protein
MQAKGGDKLTKKARERLARLMGAPIGAIETEVAPKTEGATGQWICITCGDPFANNMEADGHTPKHKLAWRSFVSGKIEEP